MFYLLTYLLNIHESYATCKSTYAIRRGCYHIVLTECRSMPKVKISLYMPQKKPFNKAQNNA